MAGFSEEELLLLNNYIYFDCSAKYRDFSEVLDAYSEQKDGERSFSSERFEREACAGMTSEDAKDVFERLDRATGPGGSMEGLKVERMLDEGGVRAMCVSKPTGEAAVIFRGTGGTYEAWLDNVQGEFIVDTQMQKIASDFVTYDCSAFTDLTVSGHSKGGNLSQFVTVACGQQIARCVSFDGQGFNREFLSEHKEEIEEAKPKITSVCANNDYVNILLNSIAGETVYIRNKDNTPVGAHSSYSLLKYGSFDEEGMAKRYKRNIQTQFIKSMKTVIDGIVGAIDLLPENGNEVISNLLGSVVATIFCCERETNTVDEWGEIRQAAQDVYQYTASLLGVYEDEDGEVSLCAEELYHNFDAVSASAERFSEIRGELAAHMDRVDTIREELSDNVISDIALSVTMDRTREKLYRNLNSLQNITEVLREIGTEYIRKEREIAVAI
ncbi:MAG: DUF2974 domain-containing protein [Lachnospiraceae bacterium]|nr:DUF2974 domain-containing protein [Lachnospiraceae bacterium]